jgi:hypothetical protein
VIIAAIIFDYADRLKAELPGVRLSIFVESDRLVVLLRSKTYEIGSAINRTSYETAQGIALDLLAKTVDNMIRQWIETKGHTETP